MRKNQNVLFFRGADVDDASRRHNTEGAMSTVRIKRKHVLDSDSDDDDAPSTSIAVASVSNGSSEKENAGVAPVGPPADGEATGQMFKKRLTKKAESAPPREVVVIEDGPGTAAAADDDDVIVVDDDDAPPPPPQANDGDDVVIEDDIDEPDQALVECAKISRKLRRALGADDDAKGKSDGPLSPGASHAPGGRRKLVTARDVAAVAGEGSTATGLKPYQMVGANFLLLLDEQDVPAPSSTRWARQDRADHRLPRVPRAAPTRGAGANRAGRRTLLELAAGAAVGARAARGVLPRRAEPTGGAVGGGGVVVGPSRGRARRVGRRSFRRRHCVLLDF